MGSQVSKTETLLTLCGHKLDTDPAPLLYIGPTKSNVEKVIEPRAEHMIRNCPSLAGKVESDGKRRKLAKRIAGVLFRFAWAGSPTELASQPAHTVVVDEVDRMKPIPGEGDPVALARVRTATYPDGRLIAASSPTEGTVTTEIHPETGIEHWRVADADDIASPIWRLWQEGTRYEWAVPCPHCGEFFVPRFHLLKWKTKDATPLEAQRDAHLACPRNGCVIENDAKGWCNQAGTFLAPGQSVEGFDLTRAGRPDHAQLGFGDGNGRVVGDVEDSDTDSFWVSGLMSPWVPFGTRALEWIEATRSGDQERIRVLVNTAFGELYAVRGEAPDWAVVRDGCAADYSMGDVPAWVQRVFVTADVQKDRIVYVVRGWGAGFRSALLEHGELWGPSDQNEPFDKLDEVRGKQFGGLPVFATAIDANYRTDQVYEYARTRGLSVYATIGKDNPAQLYAPSDVARKRGGKTVHLGMKRWVFNATHFKGWVHDRLVLPQEHEGAWHLPSRTARGEPIGSSGQLNEYCRQIVGEQRIRLPSGRTLWKRVGENHYLDCEAQQALLAQICDVRLLRPIDQPAPQAPPPGRRVRSAGVSV